MITSLCKKFIIPRIYLYHIIPVGKEKIMQNKDLLLRGKTFGRGKGVIHIPVHSPVLSIVPYLFKEGRDKVKGLMYFREIPEYRNHIIIVLYPMEPHPGKCIITLKRIPVIGLVHMPEKHYIQWSFHCRFFQLPLFFFLLGPVFLFPLHISITRTGI